MACAMRVWKQNDSADIAPRFSVMDTYQSVVSIGVITFQLVDVTRLKSVGNRVIGLRNRILLVCILRCYHDCLLNECISSVHKARRWY